MALKVVFFDLGDTLVTAADRGWISGSKGLLAALKSRALRLGVISNTGSLTRTELTALLPADFDWGLFESRLIVLSSAVGVEKPSAAIFEEAVQLAGIPAGDCLFVTEDLVDTLAAQGVGMRAARVAKPPTSELGGLVAALVKAGLLRP